MSLHKKALGLDSSAMLENLIGSGQHGGMQSEVLEHKFKELEKKLDKSAQQFRNSIKTSAEPGFSANFEENPEFEATKSSEGA